MAQTKYLQKELDRQGKVSFARLSADSLPQPVRKSGELLKNMYSMRNTDGLKPSEIRKDKQDESGNTHQYYQQYYKNVKVENGEVSVHANRDGNIETVFGYFKPVGDVNTESQLSELQALQYAFKYIGAEVYKWQIPEEEQWIKEYFNGTYYPVGELVIVKDRLKTDINYRLAYRFDIYAHQPMSRDYVWVDAITGDIIDMASRIMFANATGMAVTRYSGTRTITTDSYNGSYRLRATKNGVNISTFNMNHTGSYTSTDFTDNDNNWTTAEHQANNNNAALDAHWGAEMTYEYFKQVHSRNSWNNNGGALLSYVNADLRLIYNDSRVSNDNAFWDGSRMTYGQGTSWPPVVALDICAHEIGHGIFQSEVNYTSSTGEFGAINESLSDIWGACVENWATTNKRTWLCGEDLGIAARSMSNPDSLGQPDTYGRTFWFNINGCTPNGDNDQCGVHRNSGVMNYWFYLLSVGGSGTNDIGKSYNITGIGIDKAAKILYKAETDYMSASTNFTNARNATISAASNLYGINSTEEVVVTAA
jgi:Zn-dependent metalloprotease